VKHWHPQEPTPRPDQPSANLGLGHLGKERQDFDNTLMAFQQFGRQAIFQLIVGSKQPFFEMAFAQNIYGL
jgi:hypothetical protein